MAKDTVISVVPTRTQAENIVKDLNAIGIAYQDISVVLPDTRGSADMAHEKATKAPEGAATGAGAGGLVGGTLGLLAGIGALAIPGLGALIAAGPLMAALSGAAVGAGLGGVTGGLVGLGIPEVEAKQYEGKILNGNIVMAVHNLDGEEAKQVKEIFKRAGVTDVSITSEKSVPDELVQGREIPVVKDRPFR